jgi:hypothetical protein
VAVYGQDLVAASQAVPHLLRALTSSAACRLRLQVRPH